MSNTTIEKLKTYVPSLHSRWWTGLLGLSLMANLLVGGAIIGKAFHGGRGENMAGQLCTIGAAQIYDGFAE